MTADQAEAPLTLSELLERAEQELSEARAVLDAFHEAIGRAGRLWRMPDGRLFILDGESDLDPAEFLPEGAVELVPAPRATTGEPGRVPVTLVVGGHAREIGTVGEEELAERTGSTVAAFLRTVADAYETAGEAP